MTLTLETLDAISDFGVCNFIGIATLLSSAIIIVPILTIAWWYGE